MTDEAKKAPTPYVPGGAQYVKTDAKRPKKAEQVPTKKTKRIRE